MNLVKKIIFYLQLEMKTPVAFGWFHWLWIFFTIIAILFLYFKKKKSKKYLNKVLLIYGIVALLLETLKQLSWGLNYDVLTNKITWDYEWYAFPFQLCTTPIYASLLYLIIKNKKIKLALLSYLAFVTILGSFMTIIIPDSCFVSDILINIHTMWLHCGSFVVSIYLLMSGIVEINIKNLKSALLTFIIFVGIALALNLIVFNIGILNGETFNMFYISPYFISSLPIFDIIQQNVPYLIYLIIYLFALMLGSFIVYHIAKFIKRKK